MKATLRRALEIWLGGDAPTPSRLARSALVTLGPAALLQTSLFALIAARGDAHVMRQLKSELHATAHLLSRQAPQHTMHAPLQRMHQHIAQMEEQEASAHCLQLVHAEVSELNLRMHRFSQLHGAMAAEQHLPRLAQPALMAAEANLRQCAPDPPSPRYISTRSSTPISGASSSRTNRPPSPQPRSRALSL
jgi:hypothetical protein